MIRSRIYLLIFLVIITISFTKKENKENQVILVELFTSQGCSSCPKADEVLKDIKEKYNDKNVIPLSFHVDYWDRLGWKDTFSQAKFSDRQRDYAKKFKSNSIYTPQMIINGTDQFVGSYKSKAFELIKRRIGGDQLIVKGNIAVNTNINISYSLPKINYKAYDLNIVLVKNKESVAIKRGENWGRKIQYHNIVFDFKSLKHFEEKGEVSFKKPKNFNDKDFSIVLFLQEKRNGKIVAVKKINYS